MKDFGFVLVCLVIFVFILALLLGPPKHGDSNAWNSFAPPSGAPSGTQCWIYGRNFNTMTCHYPGN